MSMKDDVKPTIKETRMNPSDDICGCGHNRDEHENEGTTYKGCRACKCKMWVFQCSAGSERAKQIASLPVPEESKEAQPDSVKESETRIERLTDLVRYMRHELHDADLISEEEFTALVIDSDGGKRVARLEGYDAVIAAQIAKTNAAEAELTSLRGAGWVSVDERLPIEIDATGESAEVPAIDDEGELLLGKLRYRTDGGENYWIGNYCRRIVLWFDLPQPPDAAKEREKEK
jgi:hypothetical protein